MNPIITTVIPTFQRPELLKKAIDSVLSQTYPHFQICVCDNGSDDATLNLMREFVQKDSRVKYHRHPQNIGMMKNYKYGFSKITTPYFSFLSDDDYLSPWFYETALIDLQQFPDAGFSVCAVQVINKTGQPLFDSLCLWNKKGYFEVKEGFLEMLSPNFKPPIPTCTLFNRKVLQGISLDWSNEIQPFWDPDFFLQIAAQFPYIINGKSCGFFLAHDEGFSSGLHSRLRQSSKDMEVYLRASRCLIWKIMKNEHLAKTVKSHAKKILLKFFREHIYHHLESYLKERKYFDVLSAFAVMVYFIGVDKAVFLRLIKNVVKKTENQQMA